MTDLLLAVPVPYAEDYADALAAAYASEDQEDFAEVLRAVAHEDADVIWDAMTILLLAAVLNATT